ncbi:MAG: 50S ribosomal protein L15 [Rhodospirillales bacterium]|nr:50S ribosomal protein L15 [Rhodospirillales bacterium]
MRLNEISDKHGATKARKRVGRGIGSGTGKTASRGVKGQKSRSGVAIKGFEGGQMPIHRRLPKRGFHNYTGKRFSEIGLDTLQTAIDAKKIDASKPVTEKGLKDAGIITHLRDGVRVLGNGVLTVKVTLEVAGATKSAIAGVETAGGTINILQPKADKSAKTERRKTKGKKDKAKQPAAAPTKDAGKDAGPEKAE